VTLCVWSRRGRGDPCPQELKSEAGRFPCPRGRGSGVGGDSVAVSVVCQSLVRLIFLEGGKKSLGCGSTTEGLSQTELSSL